MPSYFTNLQIMSNQFKSSQVKSNHVQLLCIMSGYLESCNGMNYLIKVLMLLDHHFNLLLLGVDIIRVEEALPVGHPVLSLTH